MKKSIYGLKMKSIDTSEKGIVTILANGLEIEDYQGDISCKGSFKKTLNDFNSGKRTIFHYKNHVSNDTVGFITKGEETGSDLVVTSQLNLNKQIGLETFEDYKLAQELGKNIEHSIGVYAVKRDKEDKRRVLEWHLEEVSTLTKRGANPSTGFIDLKAIDAELNPIQAIAYLKEVLNKRYPDDKLKTFENQLILLEKAFIKEAELVQCSSCNHSFDYNSQKEYTYEEQVIDIARNYHRWITEDIVSQEMIKLEPEIRDQVLNILGTNKSLLDDMSTSYVYCPKCYTKIHKSSIIKVKEPSETGTHMEKPLQNTFSWKSLSTGLKQ